MKRVQIKMDLLRNIVSGLSQVGGFTTTEELINFLTLNAEDCYFMDVEDHQVTDFRGDFDGDTLNTVEYKAIEPFEDTIELTERAIEQLSANAQIGYILHNPDAKEATDKRVIMMDGEPVAMVTDVSSFTNADNKGKIAFLGMDTGEKSGIGVVQTLAPSTSGKRFFEICGAKVDAVFFDETCDDGPKPCMDCGFPTDQQNSQTIIDGEVRYRCDDCEKECDEREEDE